MNSQPQKSAFSKLLSNLMIAFSFIIIIGVIFKIFHWPGAAIFLIFGLLGSSCLYFLHAFNSTELKGISKFIHQVMYVSFSIFITGFLFMIMHWPGSGTMVAVGIISFVLVYILYLFNHLKSKNSSSFDIQIISFLLILILTSTFMRVSKDVLKANIVTNEQSEEKLSQLDKTSDGILASIEKNQTDSLNDFTFKKVKEISSMINNQIDYIEKLKHHILDETEHAIVKDTASLRYAYSLDNYDIPTHILIGDDETKPINGEFTAVDLKNRLTSLQENAVILIGEIEKNNGKDFSTQKEIISNIKPVDPNEKIDGIAITWEIYNFYHHPMSSVICRLSQIQLDLKHAELLLLTKMK